MPSGFIGIDLYVDILSLLFVLGGAIGYALMKNTSDTRIKSFGEGAVFLAGSERWVDFWALLTTMRIGIRSR